MSYVISFSNQSWLNIGLEEGIAPGSDSVLPFKFQAILDSDSCTPQLHLGNFGMHQAISQGDFVKNIVYQCQVQLGTLYIRFKVLRGKFIISYKIIGLTCTCGHVRLFGSHFRHLLRIFLTEGFWPLLFKVENRPFQLLNN